MVTKIVIAENTNSMNNLRFRGFHGDDDYPHILNILTSCKTVDGPVRSDTLVDIIRTYTHLRNCDPYTDMLFAEVAGETVGYSRVWWDREAWPYNTQAA